MEKHILKAKSFNVVEVCFRKRGEIANWGSIIVNEKFEFTGYLTGDIITARIINNKYKVIYHCVRITPCEDPILKAMGGMFQEEVDYEFELMTLNLFEIEDMIGLRFQANRGEFSVAFEKVVYDPIKRQRIIQENKNLIELY